MPQIAVEAATWRSLTDAQRAFISTVEVPGTVQLGSPASFTDENSTEWCVWDDSRITPDLVASVAALIVDPTQIPTVVP